MHPEYQKQAAPGAFTPYVHQVEGRDFLAARRVAFLLDQMGLGKTWSMIAAADQIAARAILTITVAAARTHIAREFARHSPGRNVQVLERGNDPITGDVVITSYALARSPSVRRQLMARSWDLLVLDEGQALRTPGTKQTRAVLAPERSLRTQAARVWVLSGSLLPHHRIEEFYPFAAGLLGETRRYEEYRRHFGVLRATDWGWQHTANRNVEEFKATIGPHVLRRRARDVIGLPGVRYGQVTVHADQLDPEDVPEELRAAVTSGDDRAVLAAIEHASKDALARLRRITGAAKLGPTLELLREELTDPEHRVVVLAWHKGVVRGLAQGLAPFGSVILEGATPPRARQRAIDRFQAGQARAFCAQIVAGGVGIDLSAAGHVVLVEQSWNPSDNAQAVARIVRPTQRRASVLARFVALAGSIDEAVTGVLMRKIAAGRDLEMAA